MKTATAAIFQSACLAAIVQTPEPTDEQPIATLAGLDLGIAAPTVLTVIRLYHDQRAWLVLLRIWMATTLPDILGQDPPFGPQPIDCIYTGPDARNRSLMCARSPLEELQAHGFTALPLDSNLDDRIATLKRSLLRAPDSVTLYFNHHAPSVRHALAHCTAPFTARPIRPITRHPQLDILDSLGYALIGATRTARALQAPPSAP